MLQEYKLHKEHLWWVRYVTKHNLQADSQCVQPQGNAFFYATDKETLHKHIAAWQRYIEHDGVIVQEIQPVPPDFKLHFYDLLQELPEPHRIVEDITPYLKEKPSRRCKAIRPYAR
jgi:hypothetical protein